MQYGICNLSIVPLRLEPGDNNELVSQLLYGDCFKILEKRKFWSRIRLTFDKYEGWIDNKQFVETTLQQTIKSLYAQAWQQDQYSTRI